MWITCAGLGVLCRRYGLPVFANEGTWQGIRQKETGIPARCVRTFCTGEDFYIGSVNVRPFAIPHDAAEPVGFAFDCRGLRCGVATDIGHIDESWLRAVSGCQALVLEANHDVEMVKRGAYPQRLKQRILGRRGHLCNEDCAKALLRLASEARARCIYLTFLLTIIYLNWHIIRYVEHFPMPVSRWMTPFASWFRGATAFRICSYCAAAWPMRCNPAAM